LGSTSVFRQKPHTAPGAHSNAVQNRAVSKPPNVNSIRAFLPPNNEKWEAAAARSIRAIRMGLMRAGAIEQRENHERERRPVAFIDLDGDVLIEVGIA
jgi:hypothetical protein